MMTEAGMPYGHTVNAVCVRGVLPILVISFWTGLICHVILPRYDLCDIILIMKKVTLYTLSTCPTCKKVRKFLDDKGIAYTVIEVDSLGDSEQWAATRELSRHNPQASYPTVLIEDVIVGYDIDALTEKLP